MLDMSTITQGVDVIAAVVVSGVATLIGKLHLNARQLATAADLAEEAVNYAYQAAAKHGITADLGKFNAALTSVKALAAKAGIKLTDVQWETLIESAYKKSKDEMAQLVGTATPYTQDEIAAMIQAEVQKVAPDALGIVSVVQQELAKIQWAPVVKPLPDPEPAKEEKEEQTA